MKAYVIKKFVAGTPKPTSNQVTWSKHGGATEAWYEVCRRAGVAISEDQMTRCYFGLLVISPSLVHMGVHVWEATERQTVSSGLGIEEEQQICSFIACNAHQELQGGKTLGALLQCDRSHKCPIKNLNTSMWEIVI